MPEIKIVIAEGVGVGRGFLLDEPTTVGRSPGADFTLADEKASRKHCRLIPMPGGGIRVEDLGSANGIFVNGRKCRKSELAHGDRVTIGNTVLCVEAPGLASAEAAAGAATEDALRAAPSAADADLQAATEDLLAAQQTQPLAKPERPSPPPAAPGASAPAAPRGTKRPRTRPPGAPPLDRQASGRKAAGAAAAAGGVEVLTVEKPLLSTPKPRRRIFGRLGALSDDISQLTAWQRTLVWVGAVLFFIGLFLLGFAIFDSGAPAPPTTPPDMSGRPVPVERPILPGGNVPPDAPP